MLHIPCPYCGYRDETEFSHAGEAHIVRPTNGAEMTDEQWANYVFNRKNIKGIHLEQWLHSSGCRRYFNMARNTINNEIVKSYKIGEIFDSAVLGENKQ